MKAANFIQVGKHERIEISGNKKVTLNGQQIVIENDEGTMTLPVSKTDLRDIPEDKRRDIYRYFRNKVERFFTEL